MPKGIPIGFQIAEKNANRQTDTHTQTHKHFRIYTIKLRRDVYERAGKGNNFTVEIILTHMSHMAFRFQVKRHKSLHTDTITGVGFGFVKLKLFVAKVILSPCNFVL